MKPAIFWGGLIAGALDITAAFINIIHMLCVGLPIALVVSQYSK